MIKKIRNLLVLTVIVTLGGYAPGSSAYTSMFQDEQDKKDKPCGGGGAPSDKPCADKKWDKEKNKSDKKSDKKAKGEKKPKSEDKPPTAE